MAACGIHVIDPHAGPTLLNRLEARVEVDEARRRAFDDALNGLVSLIVEPYEPRRADGALDLRPSEIDWLAELQGRMSDAARVAAIAAAIGTAVDVLRHAPDSMRTHPALDSLRADLAALQR